MSVKYQHRKYTMHHGVNMSRQTLITKDSVFYLQTHAWEDTNYKDDFKFIFKQWERSGLPFLHQSPQFEYRPCITAYMKNYAAEHNLSYCCLHLSVYLLDIFMDNHTILISRLLLVANVCLFIAAKLEESCITMPKLRELSSALNDMYPLDDYKILERIILKYFEWNVKFPTAAHYIQYFMHDIININLKNDYSFSSKLLELNLIIQKYLNLIIEDVHYMQFFSPSLLATAVIYAAATEADLMEWTKWLEDLTGYTTDQIQRPLEALSKNNFQACFNCKNKNRQG